MKRLFPYYLVILSVFCFASCEKETEGLSIVTTPCELTLEGGNIVLVALGDQFVEPGYEAFEGETDMKSKVVVSGTLDVNTPGRYTLRYTVANSNGVPTVLKRTVIVFDQASPTGFYTVSASSYRNTPPSREYASEPTILIYQEESGNYYVSDLFGGYYAVGRGYGDNYASGGSIKINREGKIVLVKSDRTPWGDFFSSVDGTYDEVTQTFTIEVVWESGYTFFLTLIKQ